MLLAELLDELPEDLARQVFTHASWSERRSDSYTRLAFLGDSVLALAVTAHLYPRLEAERFGEGRSRRFVSRRSPRYVLPRGRRAALALPERLRAAALGWGSRGYGGIRRDGARARVGIEAASRRVLSYRNRATSAPPRRSSRPLRRRSRVRSSILSTSSRRCRSCSPGAARRSATRSPASRVPGISGTPAYGGRERRRQTASAAAAGARSTRSRWQRVSRSRRSCANRGYTERIRRATEVTTLNGFKSFPGSHRLDRPRPWRVKAVAGPNGSVRPERHRRCPAGDGRAAHRWPCEGSRCRTDLR